MDDTSLDDFLSGDDSEEIADESGSDADEQALETDERASETAEPASDAARSQQETDGPVATDSESADPAPSTSRWDADGVSCADCGETVQRVWDASDGLVCAMCKEWS